MSEQMIINEVKVATLLRVADKRIAVVEFETPQGKYYGTIPLYRTKEVAIQNARNKLSKFVN